MDHLRFALNCAALAAGALAMGAALGVYHQYRKALLVRFLLFLGTLFLISFNSALSLYLGLTGAPLSTAIVVLQETIVKGITAGLVVNGPATVAGLAGVRMGRPASFALWCVAGATMVLQLAVRHGGVLPDLIPILDLPLYTAGALMVALGLVFYRRIGDSAISRFLKLVFAASTAYVVYLVLAYAGVLSFGLAHPIYAIFVDLAGLSLVFRFFGKPFSMEGGEVSSFFMKTYGLTDREGEVVRLIVAGLSIPVIGQRLFIAPKTVENHVTAIHKKTGVGNRTQLVNLIVTNRQERRPPPADSA